MTRILLVTSRWNSMVHGIDGGSMTAFNIMESLKGKAECDILIPEEMSSSLPTGLFHLIHTYPPVHIVDSNKFTIRREQAILVGNIIGKIIEKYDRIIILHIFHAFSLPEIISSDAFKKIRLFPMFLSSSYAESNEEIPEWYVKLECDVLSRINSIITPSEFEKKQLINDFNVGEECIKVIPRIVGDVFKTPQNNRVPSTCIRLACVSSFRKQKRIKMAVDLIKELKNRDLCVSLTIVGSIQDYEEYTNFKTALSKARLVREINHITYMCPSDIAKLYMVADFNVSFSNCETFGRSIVESLCTGLPSIILDETGNLRSLIGVNHGAIFCSTIEDMGETILKYTGNQSMYRDLSNEASTYGEKFKIQNIATTLSNAILDPIYDPIQ